MAVVLIGIAVCVVSVQADCVKGCDCLLPAKAEELGYSVFCGGKQAVCGYDAAKNAKYCYQVPVACPSTCTCYTLEDGKEKGYPHCRDTLTLCGYRKEDQRAMFCHQLPETEAPITCPSTCTCQETKPYLEAGYQYCGGKQTVCGEDSVGNPLSCFEKPVSEKPVPCAKGCSCLNATKARVSGYQYCGGTQTLCGYDTSKNPLYCFEMSVTVKPEPVAPVLVPRACASGCSCMGSEQAEASGYTYCGGEQTLCGYDARQTPLYCFLPVTVTVTAAVGEPGERGPSSPDMRGEEVEEEEIISEHPPGTCHLSGTISNFNYNPETLQIRVQEVAPRGTAHVAVGEPELVPVIPEPGEFPAQTYTAHVSCSRTYLVTPEYHQSGDSCEWHGTWSPPSRTVEMGGVSSTGNDFTFTYSDLRLPVITFSVYPTEPRFNEDAHVFITVTDDNPIDTIDLTEHLRVQQGTSIVSQTTQWAAGNIRTSDSDSDVTLTLDGIDHIREATIEAEVCDYGGNRVSESFSVSFGTCRDGIENQGEDGVDCGGPCAPCNRCIEDPDLPASFNWLDYDTATPVQDQAGCGSCWAFAAIAATESNYKWTTGKTIDLSEQRLISCEDEGNGCWGGFPYEVLPFLQYDGTMSETCYPYQSGKCQDYGADCNCWCGDEAVCRKPCTCENSCYDAAGWIWGKSETWTIADYGHVYKSDDPCGLGPVKRALYCKGPLLVNSPWLEHTMLLVGWDSNNQTCRQKYDEDSCWILKSSWDVWTDWFDSPTEAGHHDVWVINGYVLLPTFKNYNMGHDAGSGLYSDLQCWAYWVSGTARGLETGFDAWDSIAVGHFQSGDDPDQILIKRFDSDHLKIFNYDDTRPVRDLAREEDIAKGDRIAVGDMDRDGIDEIIFGDTDDKIQIYSSRLEFIREFSASISEYDGLATGDVTQEGDRIISASYRNQDITIYDAFGHGLHYFYAPETIGKGDSVAAGDLVGTPADEIVLATTSNHVYILDYSGIEVGPRINVRFDEWDGLAVGDFNGDGRNEIAIVNDDGNKVRVFNSEGTLIKEFYHEYGHGGSTSAGDVNGDGRDELVIAQGDIIRFNEMFG